MVKNVKNTALFENHGTTRKKPYAIKPIAQKDNIAANVFIMFSNVLLCRAGHENDRKHGALSPASARTKS